MTAMKHTKGCNAIVREAKRCSVKRFKHYSRRQTPYSSSKTRHATSIVTLNASQYKTIQVTSRFIGQMSRNTWKACRPQLVLRIDGRWCKRSSSLWSAWQRRWRQKMASSFTGDGDGVLFNSSDVAPSPCKDFWQLVVTVEQVLELYVQHLQTLISPNRLPSQRCAATVF